MFPPLIVLKNHGSHILVVGIPVVLLSSSNHLLVPRTGTVALTAPETIH